MPKLSGQGGTITVSAVIYGVETWTLNLTNDLADVTTTASGGWTEKLAIVSSGVLTAKIFYDSLGAYNTVFAPGATISASLIVGSSSHTYTFPGVVKEISIENPAKGSVTISLTAESNGPVLYA